MKRAASSPNGGSKDKPFRRQNPVSCQFCRSKKLKCSRDFPCSNCIARGLDCVSALGEEVAKLPAFVELGHSGSSASVTSKSAVSDVEARLRRLERAVFSSSLQQSPQADGRASAQLTPTAAEDEEDVDITKTAHWLEAAAEQSGPLLVRQGVIEGVNGQNGSPAINPLTTYSTPNASPFSAAAIETPFTVSELRSLLPDEQTARTLLQYYVRNINWVYHILHIPTVERTFEQIYNDLRASTKPDIIKVAVASAVLAIGAYFWNEGGPLPYTREEVRVRCNLWTSLAQKALHEVNHAHRPTIETLQSTLLLTQFIPQLTENASRASSLGDLITIAHKLNLHQTDSPRNKKERTKDKVDAVDLEMRRRTWWTLASSDWLLSVMSGHQFGTYLIHPEQFHVEYPSLVDDKDISDARKYEKDWFRSPTEMTYIVGKIRLSAIAREFTDTANHAGVELDELPYETILEFDKKYMDLLADMPWYFQRDQTSLQKARELDRDRPYIAWQRTLSHFGIHTRISRLHRPYLARGYKDPRYAYSRMICLRSARLVIELMQDMKMIAGGNSGRLWIVIHHFFVATVTLVMDYCCHRDDPEADQRRREILDCYKVLEESQQESATARAGLQHLKKIMKDWRNKNQDDEQPVAEPEAAAPMPLENLSAWDSSGWPKQDVQQVQQVQQAVPYLGNTGGMEMDVMQGLFLDPFDFNAGYDQQWESLFRDLDNQPGMTMT